MDSSQNIMTTEAESSKEDELTLMNLSEEIHRANQVKLRKNSIDGFMKSPQKARRRYKRRNSFVIDLRRSSSAPVFSNHSSFPSEQSVTVPALPQVDSGSSKHHLGKEFMGNASWNEASTPPISKKNIFFPPDWKTASLSSTDSTSYESSHSLNNQSLEESLRFPIPRSNQSPKAAASICHQMQAPTTRRS